jgi:drug/metabolite transporter (DMT)-like permease
MELSEQIELLSPLSIAAASKSDASAVAVTAPPVRAYLALFAGVLCISGSALFVKLAGVAGPVSALYRFVFTGMVLVPWWLTTRSPWPTGARLLFSIVGGVFLGLDLFLWNTSIMLTSASTATILGNNAPIWVGIGTWLIFKEKLTVRYWLGLSSALLGMILVVGVGALSLSGQGRGDLMAVTAGFFYAAYMLTTQKARTLVDTLTFMTFSVVTGALLLFLFTLSLGLPLTGYSSSAWGYLIAMALISHLGGWLGVNYALGYLKASTVSVSLLSQVVVTVLLAMPLLGERMTLVQYVGGGLVMGGIYLVTAIRR